MSNYKHRYATTQVSEYSFTKEELVRLAVENVCYRDAPGYDFDTYSPIVLWDNKGNLMLRYVQKIITQENDPESKVFKPLEKTS